MPLSRCETVHVGLCRLSSAKRRSGVAGVDRFIILGVVVEV
jgi:hypothetical protein